MKSSASEDALPMEDWIKYKQEKAVAFVKRGYCVDWLPPENHWMTVYIPGCSFDLIPELRATAKFYRTSSKFGIEGGRISKLEIRESTYTLTEELLGRQPTRSNVAYNFDRGLDRDHLSEFPDSRRLYLDIIDLLN